MAARKKTISEEVLGILGRSTYSVDGKILTLPPGQLDRGPYMAVNEVLNAAGGKWNKKLRAHVFESDARAKIAAMCDVGIIKNEARDADFFATSPEFARELVELAGVKAGDHVLEPSAGHGALVLAAVAAGAEDVTMVEFLPENARVLADLAPKPGCAPAGASLNLRLFKEPDFMLCDFKGIEPFDVVVMNPPFTHEIPHVQRAWSLLKPGGKLVSVMSGGILFRKDKKTVAFRAFLAECGRALKNPPDTFKDSGTHVETITVVLDALKE